MATAHHPKLTSSEIAVLWGSYQNDTLGICIISYLLQHVEDQKICKVLEYALELSTKHIQKVTQILNDEGHPIPVGFTNQDVDLNAPRLYSDNFMLYYISAMGSMGINTYSVALPNAARKDIRDYYTACLYSSSELYNRAADLMQEIGIFIRAPYIPYIEKVEFVDKQSFLAGWIGKQRPVTTIELSFLFFNLQRNALGSSLLTGFSQVARTKAVRDYMTRGAEIAKHHCEVFTNFMKQDDLHAPLTWDIMPTRSTTPPFSDKLMMYHTAALNSSGMTFYGASLGSSPRLNIAAAYGRLMAETGEFAEDGANIMIDEGWLEMPPSVPNRKALAKSQN